MSLKFVQLKGASLIVGDKVVLLRLSFVNFLPVNFMKLVDILDVIRLREARCIISRAA